jgi:hypothetical protein
LEHALQVANIMFNEVKKSIEQIKMAQVSYNETEAELQKQQELNNANPAKIT